MASSTFTSAKLGLVSALVASMLGACHGDRISSTGSVYPNDVRARHPYVLGDAAQTLDVFPTGIGHLDPRQAADVDNYMVEFRRYGRGALLVELPRGGAPGTIAAAERTAATVRRIAAEHGVPASAILVSGYDIASPSLASPVRLSFQRMQARVASQCGLWPQDLGTSDPVFNLRNDPHWNLGCATRSNIAAQIADPVDIARARPEGRIDTVRREQVINKLRQGNDPSTQWRQDGSAKVKENIN